MMRPALQGNVTVLMIFLSEAGSQLMSVNGIVTEVKSSKQRE
jgi:hypothetical protein